MASACGGREEAAPPVATPTVTLNHAQAPAGSPLDITYKFVVADDARFDEDYRVFVHVIDVDEEFMWDADHDPAMPTSQWKPGQTIEYTRTIFVPVFPYVGEATIQIGLHSKSDGHRLHARTATTPGQNAYRVAKVQLLPQTDNLLTVFKDGWHQAEVAGDNATIEWQWTKKEAVLAFRNPKKDATFFLDVDSPGGAVPRASTDSGRAERPGGGRVHARRRRAHDAARRPEGCADRRRRDGRAADPRRQVVDAGPGARKHAAPTSASSASGFFTPSSIRGKRTPVLSRRFTV